MPARLLPFPSRAFAPHGAATAPSSAEQEAGTLRPSDVIEIGRAILEGGAEPAATLQKIAAAVVELRLVTRLPHLHALFPDPLHALGIHRPLCRIVCGVKDDELLHCAEMLGATVTSACREAAEGLDKTFDPEAWADVLTEILRPQRPAASGACEVQNIETLRLIRFAKRGAFCGASDVEGDDVA
jgi:hypothetical protein